MPPFGHRKLLSTLIDRRVLDKPVVFAGGGSDYTLLRLDPDTGRRHQLRRHLAHVSRPIIGDSTYGKGRHNRLSAETFGVRRLLLACVRLEFTHPVTGQPVVVTARPGTDFDLLCDRLGWRNPGAPEDFRAG